MSRDKTLRDWEPGDGLRCSYHRSSPIPCGQPVRTEVAEVSIGPRQGTRIRKMPLCALHVAGRTTGRTPGVINAEAQRAALQRLAHENWETYERYVQEYIDAQAARFRNGAAS